MLDLAPIPEELVTNDWQSNVTRNYAEKTINNILDYVGGEGKVGAAEDIRTEDKLVDAKDSMPQKLLKCP